MDEYFTFSEEPYQSIWKGSKSAIGQNPYRSLHKLYVPVICHFFMYIEKHRKRRRKSQSGRDDKHTEKVASLSTFCLVM